MPVLNIEGVGRVTVGDEFLTLSPEQQENAVQEIAKTAKTDIGRGKAFAIGAEQGLTANFGDELRGVKAAAGLNPGQKVAAAGVPFVGGAIEPVVGLARLGLEYLTGGDEAAKRYAASRDEFREQVKTAEKQYPGTTLAGQAVGAIALPAGAALQAATLPGRMVRGAMVGGAYGGAAGAGEGTTPEERAVKGAVGTGIGVAAGGLGVPVVEGAARGVAALASKPINTLRAAINPEGAAERAVGRSYNEAVISDPTGINRLLPNELAPGGPQTVMDTLGGPGRDLARSAANLSGGARDILNQTLDERYVNQAGRLTQWLNSTFNYPNVHAQQQALTQAAKNVNNPAYKKAFSNPNAQGMWDEGFEQISQAPAVQESIRGAMVNARDEAARMGFTPPRNPFVSDQSGRFSLRTNPDGSRMLPGLQFWDAVKKNLDKINARESQFWARTLRDRLDEIVPEYGQARAGAAHFFRANDALEAGQNYVSMNFANAETRQALSKMSQVERRLFQDGFVSRLVETLEGIPDRADVVRRIYNSTAAREKIHIALGQQRARELEAMLRIENIMQQSLRAVQGNSSTAAQLLAAGAAGASGGGYLGFDPTASGLAAALAMAGKRGIDQRVATRIAELLTSHDPATVNRGMRMIASSNRMMDVLRSADAAAARVSGGQAQAIPVPAMNIPNITRAENEPEIPGPPAQ